VLGFFPRAYPDELLYSLCARYSDRVQYPSKLAINQELFGTDSYGAIIDLPYRLQYLINSLPRGHSLTSSKLINFYTLYPFYCPFLPQVRSKRLYEVMKGLVDFNVYSIVGLAGCTIHKPTLLRYCPVCAEQDKGLFGESYWHRLHQVPGVEVCPTHSVFLENSSSKSSIHKSTELYISAEKNTALSTSRPLNLSAPSHCILIDIANDAAWLLAQSNLVLGSKVIRTCYMSIFAEHGIETPNRRFRQRRLVDKFLYHYPNDLLRLLQCDFESLSYNWLVLFLNTLKNESLIHPLRHLLLIRCLGYTAKSFFERCLLEASSSSCRERIPFGRGPWPCLNPACMQFRKRSVKECHAVYRKRHGMPTGVFSCSCGFVYQRRGPDTSPKDLFRKSRVRTYGHVWEAELRKLWNNSSISLERIARRFGCCKLTIKFQATRLGLTFPRLGNRNKWIQFDQKLERLTISPYRVQPQMLRLHRKKWLDALNSNTLVTRTELRKRLVPHTYYWLSKHDKEWLEARIPSVKRSGRTVDWMGRDTKLAEEVRRIAVELRSISEQPSRITSKMILKRTTQRFMFFKDKNRCRFPRTTAALAEVVETRVEFAIRRVQWAAECFGQENIIPTISTLKQRACVGFDVWEIPAAKAAFKAAMRSLQESDERVIEVA
jgi:hypothetical protein